MTSRFVSRWTARLAMTGLSLASACGPKPPARAAEAATLAPGADAAAAQAGAATADPAHGASAAGAAGAEARVSTRAAAANLPWWDEPYATPFDGSKLTRELSFIHVKGNHFENDAGKTVVFQGVNISDPDKLEQMGHFNRRHFEVISEWGANVVRIPIHPTAWRRRGPAGYFELLDQVVHWANELSMYVIVDWHSMGNLRSELFQHPMYDTTLPETLEFWRTIAFRYKGVSTVAFYELFNEPTVRNGTLGNISWEQWKAINEEAISIIHAHDKRAIPLVAGFSWAYDLTPVRKAPIAREGIAYVAHPYPQKTTAPYEQNWEKDWGFVADKYPLMATEIGYMGEKDPGAHRPAIDDGSYGPRITSYLGAKGASWTAWCFDPDWPPQLVRDWSYTPTPAGEHFRKAMLDNAHSGRPASN
jgi:hypothetical protein